MNCKNNKPAQFIELIIYLAGLYPRYIGCDDTDNPLRGNIRTKQRIMKGLSEEGYIESLGTHPRSYRLNPKKFDNLINIKPSYKDSL